MALRYTQRPGHEYHPVCDWPDESFVQWGEGGLVISKKGNYTTAFFEAFPPPPGGEASIRPPFLKPDEGGFVRGEGGTIEEAERKAFAKYEKKMECQHRWTRGSYSNGYGHCALCGAGSSVFHPIHELGAWKKKPGIYDLESLATGHLIHPDWLAEYETGWSPADWAKKGYPVTIRPKDLRTRLDNREKESTRKYELRTILRLLAAGLDFPDPENRRNSQMPESYDVYIRACRSVVADYLIANHGGKAPATGESGEMGKFFDALHARCLEDCVRQELEEREREPAAAGADAAGRGEEAVHAPAGP